MKTLIVAEKPSVAQDIAAALGCRRVESHFEGGQLIVSSALGHLVELHVPEAETQGRDLESLPIIPVSFQLAVIDKRGKQVDALKRLMRRADVSAVVNACDAGREGELIFRYIQELIQCRKPVKRMWLQSMTTDSIRAAYADMRPSADFDALYAAARCRSEADWLVGINTSRAAKIMRSRQSGSYEVTSAGRVQTPVLSLLVEREAAIQSFVPCDFWEVKARFRTSDGGTYEGRWFRSRDTASGDDRFRVFTVVEAREIVQKCSGEQARVAKEQSVDEKEMAPRLFDLTTLQREANVRLGLSAKETLDIAQALYERHKVVTYPRTDAKALPEDYVDNARAVLDSLRETPLGAHALRVLQSGWVVPDKRIFDNSKISDHFAIIPTGALPKGLSDFETKLYALIARRFVAAFHPPARFKKTTRETVVGGESFHTSGRVLQEEGWLAVYGGREKDAGAASTQLCPVAEGDLVEVVAFADVKSKTKPPERYTEATLLGAMEHAGSTVEDEALREAMKERGLGTPATRAATIEKLLQVGYVGRSAKSLVPTEKGVSIVGFFKDHGVGLLTSAAMTADWEQKLHEMERTGAGSQAARARFMSEIEVVTKNIVAAISGAVSRMTLIPEASLRVACPTCGAALRLRQWAAECEAGHFRVSRTVASRPLSPLEIEELTAKGAIGPLTGFVSSKTRKKFSASLKLVDGGRVEFVFEEPRSGPPVRQARSPSRTYR